MSLEGTIQNGMVVLDPGSPPLAEGTRVEVAWLRPSEGGIAVIRIAIGVLCCTLLAASGCQRPKSEATFQEKGTGAIEATAVLERRQLVALGCEDGTVRLWNPSKQEADTKLRGED